MARTIMPQRFAVFFFRIVKTLRSTKRMKKKFKGKEGGLDHQKVLKHFSIMPTTFVVAGNTKRPALNEQDDTDYLTNNKKIIMTKKLNKVKDDFNEICIKERRKRVFYRDDKRDMLKGVFMTYDEIQNCKFEPNAGSLNPYYVEAKTENPEAPD